MLHTPVVSHLAVHQSAQDDCKKTAASSTSSSEISCVQLLELNKASSSSYESTSALASHRTRSWKGGTHLVVSHNMPTVSNQQPGLLRTLARCADLCRTSLVIGSWRCLSEPCPRHAFAEDSMSYSASR